MTDYAYFLLKILLAAAAASKHFSLRSSRADETLWSLMERHEVLCSPMETMKPYEAL